MMTVKEYEVEVAKVLVALGDAKDEDEVAEIVFAMDRNVMMGVLGVLVNRLKTARAEFGQFI